LVIASPGKLLVGVAGDLATLGDTPLLEDSFLAGEARGEPRGEA